MDMNMMNEHEEQDGRHRHDGRASRDPLDRVLGRTNN